jgi:hypothetical protein
MVLKGHGFSRAASDEEFITLYSLPKNSLLGGAALPATAIKSVFSVRALALRRLNRVFQQTVLPLRRIHF